MDKNLVAQRLTYVFEELARLYPQLSDNAVLAESLGYKPRAATISEFKRPDHLTETRVNNIAAKLRDRHNVNPDYIFGKTDDMFTGRVPGDVLRNRKAFGTQEPRGIIFVPISAQAGYSLHYDESLYLEQLERVFIPGMPYNGERYRIFEVEGDSMEPTLEEGYFVIAERVEQQDFRNTAQYYIYVVVRESQMLIKRLFRRDDGDFVMISDNEEYYAQQLLHKEDIKELWLVKRKMDWNMPPPKRFDIKL